MAISLSDIMSVLQNGVSAVQDLGTKLGTIFPQTTAISTVAPAAGAVTFTSSQAETFLSVTTSSGGIYRIPLYL